ncbi:MAG TPA: hypothetical protein VL354_07790 [Spirochaetia bacterium]|nr:hypothetical protein [Spirochaetia bacterium]
MGEAVCRHCGMDATASDDFLDKVRETCFNFLVCSRDERILQCLDTLNWPAALVAADHSVLLGNELLVGSPGVDVGELRIGDILGCVNAALLGKCGQTVACFLCGIRKSVEHSLRTGETIRRFLVSFQKRSGANQSFLITAEKAGENVLMIIEPPVRPPEGESHREDARRQA